MACCSFHLLKFCPIDDETPDFGDELSKLSSGRCRRQVSLRGRPAVRVPLCAEDEEETDEASLFDDEWYLVGLCPAHAELVLSRAVEGASMHRGSVFVGRAFGHEPVEPQLRCETSG